MRYNGGWFEMLLTASRKLIHFSAGLLAPASGICAVCGKAIHGAAAGTRILPDGTSSALLRRTLCGACQGSIPWLHAIACPICGRGVRCEDCRRRPVRPFIMNRSAVAYDPRMREWLALYKYRGQERLGPILAEMMLPAYRQLSGELNGGAWDAITYVPVSEERAQERGFNQAEQMARHLAATSGVPLIRLLERTRHSGKMSFKSRSERMRDVRSLFAVWPNGWHELQRLPGPERHSARILLVDDIYTTGSTATACAGALQEADAGRLAVYVLTWARS